MKLGKQSCETCPHRLPMDKESWARVAKAQREITPQLSRGQCAKLTRIERRTFEGLEANVENCEGYSPIQALGNRLLRKVSIDHARKKTEAGGARFVSWREKTCKNPYLDSPEYFALEDEINAMNPQEKLLNFKSDRQEEAFFDDQAGMSRMMLGAAAIAAGGFITEALPSPESAIGGGIFGLGLYTAVTGGIRVAKALHVQFQEHRNHQE